MSSMKLKVICFSPTRTTRRVLDAIVEGLSADRVGFIDITRVESVPESYSCGDDDLVIIGVPVYYGRVPVVAAKRFEALKADGIPVVPVVVFGNREYDDALLELSDMVTEAGFKTVAAAAFIGEHSFDAPETPIATGRPDQDDCEIARCFGRDLAEKFEAGAFKGEVELIVPGNKPYKELIDRPVVSPVSNDNCELCGSCERVCPTGAICVGSLVETDASKCIYCCACVKVCAFDARVIEAEQVINASKYLAKEFSTPRQPEIFFPAG